MALELRVLHLAGSRKSIVTLGSILSIGNLKARPHSDTLPPTKPHLIVSLLMRLWGPVTFKLPQLVMCFMPAEVEEEGGKMAHQVEVLPPGLDDHSCYEFVCAGAGQYRELQFTATFVTPTVR